jgi:hypothetical protein
MVIKLEEVTRDIYEYTSSMDTVLIRWRDVMMIDDDDDDDEYRLWYLCCGD